VLERLVRSRQVGFELSISHGALLYALARQNATAGRKKRVNAATVDAPYGAPLGSC
jgi:hypothetical protein